MLNYSYQGEFFAEGFEKSRDFLDLVVQKHFSNLQIDLRRLSSNNSLSYISKRSSANPGIILSLTKRFPDGFDQRGSSVIFRNEISWGSYFPIFSKHYEEFAEVHKELFKFYEKNELKNINSWSDWEDFESNLFFSGELNFLYSGKEDFNKS